MKTIKLLDAKGNEHEYVPVSEKILVLKNKVEEGVIDYNLTCKSQYYSELKGWKCHATLTINRKSYKGVEIGIIVSTYTGDAFKRMSEGDFGQNALQWCDTVAKGRACTAAGIGVEYGTASFEEVATNKEYSAHVKKTVIKDGKEVVIVLYKCVANPEITIPFDEENVILHDLTFDALIDSDRTAGDQIGFIADQVQGS